MGNSNIGGSIKNEKIWGASIDHFTNLMVIRCLKYERLLLSMGSWNWLLSSSALILDDQEAIVSANHGLQQMLRLIFTVA